MYLTRLETHGFKTFAKKTVVDFCGPKKSLHALTVIVGPNGSGKSNLADAIRWCLGEQSMKQLRGKKTEDIIFSGAKGKSRSGFAEVALVFDNSDKSMKVDYSEVTITRRLYRDGESEYLLNGKQARLADIQLLLAEAGIGQRSYTVIGQGMVDHVLIASPEERKVFFDDATGVRGFQIKRHQTMLKLRKSTENLIEIEMLLTEIEPRLRLLKRQIKRLEKREIIESELHAIQEKYFGTLWWNYQDDLQKVGLRFQEIDTKIEAKKNELKAGDEKLLAMEKAAAKGSVDDSGTKQAQQKYREAQNALRQIEQADFAAERELEMAKIRAQSTWAPLPLSEIIKELDDIIRLDESNGIIKLIKMVQRLRERLIKPNPDDYTPDAKLIKAKEATKKEVTAAQQYLRETEKALDDLSKKESRPDTRVFEFQRDLRKIQTELHTLEQEQNTINIEKARVETRIEGLEQEMQEEIAERREEIKKQAPQSRDRNTDDSRAQMLRLKHQLELIGGIDDETISEYKETEERFNFLNGQTTDLKEAISTTEKIIDELDERIQKQSEKAFKTINEEFKKYFKVLFGGGDCSLIKLKEADISDYEDVNDNKVTMDRAMSRLAERSVGGIPPNEMTAGEEMAEEKNEKLETEAEAALRRFKKRRDIVAGIDIQATPPGKKLKALNLLSGGERALTSIALLSAIMATNPSPFVVLDEVDAALDEANTVRFANILNELRQLTQFIVITHNRATMERADLLYGVTMGDDGMSNLLSVNLTDIEETGTARR
ncbi:MAG: AAA family ATPase [Patescibacteria group bacterium]|nr:AAA family ATPase [Patescibacteria group bacterium]